MGPVNRDRSWIEREYGTEKWPAIEAQIAATDGPLRSALPRLVRNRFRDDIHREQEITVAGDFATVPEALSFSGYLGWIMHTIAAYAEDADAVIELGSGWGLQLLSVYLGGGPPGAHYIAAEFTEAGRRASAALASREPHLNFDALPFDYNHPSLAIPRYERAVVFSVHSIEQIPTLQDEFVPFVKDLADQVTVLHFEPVGWQFTGGDDTYAREHDYNRNLVEVLQRAEAEDKLKILHTAIDVVGVSPLNPTTLVVWE